MIRIFSANAVARTHGWVTLARIVLYGPVLKNRQNSARKIHTQAIGNGVQSISRMNGQQSRIPTPETRKYDPGKRARKASPACPPSRVGDSPVPTVIAPKVRLTRANPPAWRTCEM